MARRIAMFAFLALISAVATARTYTTTITTTTTESESSTCKLRIMLLPEQISHCRMWLETQGGQEHLSPCCTQLSSVHSQCRCEIIKKMMWEMMQDEKQQQYGYGESSMEKMMDMAEMLPGTFCKMDTPKRCSIKPTGTPYYWSSNNCPACLPAMGVVSRT